MATGATEVRDEVVEVCDGRLRLHVKVAGSGPPVVFFHPLPGLAWQPLLDRLAERPPSTRPSIPGQRRATRRRSARCTRSGSCCSHTRRHCERWGSSVPRWSASRSAGWSRPTSPRASPTALSRLVLLVADRPVARRRSDPARGDGHRAGGGAAVLPVQAPGERGGAGDAGAPRRPGEGPDGDRAGRLDIGCTTKFCWPIADHGLARRLHRISVPTLVVWGREDALVPAVYAEEFGSRIAGSRVELLDDCGHALQGDQPERTLNVVSEFLG